MWQRQSLPSGPIKARLAKWPAELHPLAEQISLAAENGVWHELDSDALLLGHRPDIGQHAFDITLHPALDRLHSEQLQKRDNFNLCAQHREALRYFNGGQFWELNVYGLLDNLNRSIRQPLDASMGWIWAAGYEGAVDGESLFASLNISNDGQIGYFMKADGGIVGRGNGGDKAEGICGSWPGLKPWLADSLILARS